MSPAVVIVRFMGTALHFPNREPNVISSQRQHFPQVPARVEIVSQRCTNKSLRMRNLNCV